MTRRDIYDLSFVASLFNEMARTCGVVNLIASFGFARRWRRQCLRSVEINEGSAVLDLMSGMGELFPDLLRAIGPHGNVRAIDISPEMCDRARQHTPDNESRLRVIEADALHCPIEDGSVDCAVSTFGLKTLNSSQATELAHEVARVLRPGGHFAFLEISVPPARALRWPYMFYLNRLVPLIGWLALGNPHNYRLLNVYTSAFRNCKSVADCFVASGLTVDYKTYFFGCATGLTGSKPNSEAR